MSAIDNWVHHAFEIAVFAFMVVLLVSVIVEFAINSFGRLERAWRRRHVEAEQEEHEEEA